MSAEHVPFASAEEAWFWAVRENEVRGGQPAVTPRPCKPGDVIRVVDRLRRQHRLDRDHLCILVHYGRRQSPPDPERSREARAATLWREAMDQLGALLAEKGWVPPPAAGRLPTESPFIKESPSC